MEATGNSVVSSGKYSPVVQKRPLAIGSVRVPPIISQLRSNNANC